MIGVTSKVFIFKNVYLNLIENNVSDLSILTQEQMSNKL